MNKDIDLSEYIINNKYIPNVESIIRAWISSIPFAWSALDHLLFDKAYEIRLRNIELSIRNISEKVESFGEATLDLPWFQNEESIKMIRKLFDLVNYENDKEKTKTLSYIYAISWTSSFSSDTNKMAVLNKIAELTTFQKDIFYIIGKMNPQNRTVSGWDISYTWVWIWINDIVSEIKTSSKMQWKGTLKLDTELDIIESLNLIRRLNVPWNELAYLVTWLWKLVIDYLDLI